MARVAAAMPAFCKKSFLSILYNLRKRQRSNEFQYYCVCGSFEHATDCTYLSGGNLWLINNQFCIDLFL